VYTHLSRVGVWIGYPYTLDIEILRLNSNRLNKNQSNHTNKHLPALFVFDISNPGVTTSRIAQNGARLLFPRTKDCDRRLHSSCGNARTFSGLHIPEEVQPQHGATVAPCTRPHHQSALTGHPSIPGRELKEVNPEHHVMQSTALRRVSELRDSMNQRFTGKIFLSARCRVIYTHRGLLCALLLLVSRVRRVDKDVVVRVSCSRQHTGA
jgi:hypothetical protein